MFPIILLLGKIFVLLAKLGEMISELVAGVQALEWIKSKLWRKKCLSPQDPGYSVMQIETKNSDAKT